MSDLKGIGRILGAIGGILMVVFGIVAIIKGLELFVVDLGLLEFNILSESVGAQGWLASAVITIICGVIAFYGYQQLSSKSKGELLIWGIIYIVLGIVGGSLGGLLVLIGGIVLLIDYFI